MDFLKIKEAAQNYEKDMTAFLRDLARIPGESAKEEGHINRIAEEMKKLGFNKVTVDPMGNVLGYMGTGKTLIGYDAHIDTVGIGNIANWSFDPYEGYENETEIGGRGTSDQLGGIVSAVYGAKIMKDLGLLNDKYSVLVTGTVQEEDCDGLCWQYIIDEDKVKPEFVVITEPTDGNIYRGQRGRMEIRVDVSGISCHGSAPERGDNAIYKMAEILLEVRALNDRLHYDPFLGKGTLAVSEIFFTSPSRCAVADSCSISIDRRLTDGETYETALAEIASLPTVQKYDAKVSMYSYERPSYKNLVYPTSCYFPTWVIPADHAATIATVEAYKGMYGEPVVDKWTFSTNGVSIMGRYGIPCIGFGPGKEAQAHAPNEKTWKADLVKCAAVYAAIPTLYCK
jgi:putative selenium metabolism hydrolase